MLAFFLGTIDKCQCPLQVRGDKGIEHGLVAKCVLILRVTEINGHSRGKSTHNTRVEQFWRY